MFDEASFAASIERAGMTFALYWYLTTKGALLYLGGDPGGAFAPLARAAAMAPIAFTPETLYFAAMSALGCRGSTPEETDRHSSLLGRCLTSLDQWSRACPANYLHKFLLVQAEKARLEGEVGRATRLYEHAISAARRYNWPRDLALANELCAELHIAEGHVGEARACLTEARLAYGRWGAKVHVDRLGARALGARDAEIA